METASGTTIWDTSSSGYAGLRVSRGSGSGNYNYGWARLEYNTFFRKVWLNSLVS